MEDNKIHEAILKIQRLPIVKNINNDYGKFKYLKIATILSDIDGVLVEFGLRVKFEDKIILSGDRYYVKAKASLIDGAGNKESSVAYAREVLEKTKMDEAQITGSCSTYARKYALCGLLGIEGEEDMDSKNNNKVADVDDTKRKQLSAYRMGNTDIKTEGENKCVDCGVSVSDKVAGFSRGKYKKVLCFDCQNKLNNK